MGTISRGMGTRLIRPEVSARDVVPESHAMLKKLKGTRPHIKKTGKSGIERLGVTFVKTNVITPIITTGFRIDQNTPRDMLRYRTRKSLAMRLERRNRMSPSHPQG